MALLPCEDLVAPVCEPIPVDCPTFVIHVCCCDYEGHTEDEAVHTAWQETGIQPHKLRFYAKTPSFEDIYWK